MQQPTQTINRLGFTLVELLVVIVILSVMAAVVAPYARHSGQQRRLGEVSQSLIEAVRYCRSLASDTKRITRLVLDLEDATYGIEIQDLSGTAFGTHEQGICQAQPIYPGITCGDFQGFTGSTDRVYLVFDPEQPWPQAQWNLSSGNEQRTIEINGLAERILIEERTGYAASL